MPLVTSAEMFKKAYEGHYAVVSSKLHVKKIHL